MQIFREIVYTENGAANAKHVSNLNRCSFMMAARRKSAHIRTLAYVRIPLHVYRYVYFLWTHQWLRYFAKCFILSCNTTNRNAAVNATKKGFATRHCVLVTIKEPSKNYSVGQWCQKLQNFFFKLFIFHCFYHTRKSRFRSN